MKICLVNTADDGGGAPVACRRLLNALKNEVEVKMLVQQKKTTHAQIISTVKTKFDKLLAQFRFLFERMLFIAFYEKNKAMRFAFSTANTGININEIKEVKEADIVHLHWINRGFLSINSIKSLFSLGIPMVWTMHDMWTFTGGCHYAGECNHFQKHCGDCKFLRNPSPTDISNQGWFDKETIYKKNKLVFVACSEWMANMARKSSLLKNYRIEAIPNPINTEVYHSIKHEVVRPKWNINTDTKVILFGAANINDKRKGISYFLEALNILKESYFSSNPIEVIIFGKNNSLDVSQLPFKVIAFPVISSEQDLVEIYNLADVFVLPSLEDNLPNMVMEALACSVPVVAFNQGGIPEMITHHENGYIAEYQSSKDFAKGIQWVLESDLASLKNNARKKVMDNYSEPIIAAKYGQLYQSILEDN